MALRSVLIVLLAGAIMVGCGESNKTMMKPVDPNTAPKVSVDRFSEMAGHLFVRNPTNMLPEPDSPINFDEAPFITRGLGPDGAFIEYYNFDVMSRTPAPIYVLFRKGEADPVEGQLNVIDVIPGDQGYNDFWQVVKVTVPADYKANVVTSLDAITTAAYPMEKTRTLVNCPVVPDGSTAAQRYGDESSGLTRGWYKGMVVTYFSFMEKALATTDTGQVPVSPIYVCFNINPDPEIPGSGPPSGFMTEPESDQTHNVAATLPPESDYSPLWLVNVYDNADFGVVSDLSTAESAHQVASGIATVNCPIVAYR
jgi:hypothetical protein